MHGIRVVALGIALAACGQQQPKAPQQEARPASAPSSSAPAPTSSQAGAPQQQAAPAPPAAGDTCASVQDAYARFKGVTEGKNADYIPALAKVDSSLYGIALVTADGRVCEVGDVQHVFSIQSIAKVFTAATVMQALGADAIEKKIGVNATGQPFNSIIAIETNEKHRAGNPFVNPGAIASVSLVPGGDAPTKWNSILGTMSKAAGRKLAVDAEIYKSESETNTRNRAIALLLKNYKVLEGDPMQTLDLYTRECSVAVTARDLAMMGATLANGGVNPLTHERVVDAAVATKTLALMQTNGLYESSGEWAFAVGVPAKSGVGGGILAVAPGRYAIGTFAPPLDAAGNSVRGQKAIELSVSCVGGNVFDTASASAAK